MTKRVLVTGGAGFIGSHAAQRLQSLGWETHVLDSLATGEESNVPAGAQLHVADIRADGEVRRVLSETTFDAVVHCAAQTSVERSMKSPDLDRDVNVTGTRHLLAAAKESGVKRFVFISSGGAIYGETEAPATETTVPAPRSFYGMHKYVAEEFVRASGLPFAILRPSNVYGARQRSDAEGGVLSIFRERLLAGLPLDIHGDGKQERDFVYVGDVVDAVVLGIETEADVTWNVCSGYASTVQDCARQLAAEIGCELKLVERAERAGDIRKSLLSPALIMATKVWGPPLRLDAGLRRLTADAAAVS
ncbi:MAG: NAD-dependent epimerase/dehydratase family protein [Chloroflexota bacterium]